MKHCTVEHLNLEYIILP